jgi:hypothetical protein
MKNVFFAAAVVCLAAGFALSSFRLAQSAQRRIYWVCACLAAGGALFGGMTVAAYVTSSYIKIGGKIYALTVADGQPDPEDTPQDTHAGNSSNSGWRRWSPPAASHCCTSRLSTPPGAGHCGAHSLWTLAHAPAT